MLDEEVHSQKIKNLAKDVVEAIMMLDHSKKPFKQSDISSLLSEKPSRKEWNEVFVAAKTSLNAVGLELVETEGTTKSFFVISKHRPLPCMYKYAGEEVPDRILLTLVLTYVFMKNGTVSSEDLFNHLQGLTIYNDKSTIHPYFGDVKKKVLTDFVEQLYLSVTKLADSNLYEVSWGQRAEMEITKKSILEFVCQCGYGGKIEPRHLVSHFEKVKQQEAACTGNDKNKNQEVITL